MKQGKRLIAILLGLMLLLSGCSKPETNQTTSTPSTAKQGGTFVVQLQGDPTSFNPDMKSDDNLWPISQNLYNRLLKLAPGDKPVLDLAKEYKWSDDNLKLTFTLHENVKWTYDTIIKEKWNKSDTFVNVASIDAPDDVTVVFNMKTPDVGIVPLLSWYGTFVMPEHIWNDPAYPDYAKNPAMQKPVGSGPFKFVEYKNGQQIVLEKNPDYFNGIANLDKVIFSIIPDMNTAIQAFKNGEVDYLTSSVPPANKADFVDNPDYEVASFTSINRTYLTFNMTKAPFDNPKLRQAVAKAIDRQAIYDRCGNGVGIKAESFISPLFTDFVDNQYKMPDRDIEGAKKLLEECELKPDANGVYLTVTLDSFESGTFKDIASIVQANLKEAGIKVEINMMEYAAWGEQVKQNKDFNMTMLAGYQGPDISGIYGRVGINGSINFTGYANEEMEKYLNQGAATSILEERQAAYSEVQRIMSEDMPLVLLIDNGSILPVHKGVQGTPYQLVDNVATSELTFVTLPN